MLKKLRKKPLKKHLKLSFKLVSLLIAFQSVTAQAKWVAPALTRPVMDSAAILSTSTQKILNTALEKVWNQGGSQIAIYTISDLQDQSIEQVSIDTADQWKLGDPKKDNGILFVIAPNDRAVRIEVGQGLEGHLTDAHTKRIIDETVIPLFKENLWDEGVLLGVAEILKYTDPSVTIENLPTHHPRSTGLPAGKLIFLILIFIFLKFFLFPTLGLRHGRAHGLRRSWGQRSSGGFGGFGGGGFGGGGGGFSGGGASGRW